MSLQATVCDPSIYHFCGETSNETISETTSGGIAHTINDVQSVLIGGTAVFAKKRNRNFVLNYKQLRAHDPTIFSKWAPAPAGEYQPCGQMGREITGSVAEDYSYITTLFYFLDTRYGNAFYKTTTQTVTFSANAQEAKFIGQWGAEYLAKYVISNHVLTTKTDYCLMVKGVAHILKTDVTELTVHDTDHPLILVFPQPPSMGYFQDVDIDAHGFYDYWGEAGRIELDGGDDFYLTDWMRSIGALYSTENQAEASARYFAFYLHDGLPDKTLTSVEPPEIKISSDPVCSVVTDRQGNTLYSIKIGSEIFNGLIGPSGEAIPVLPDLFPDYHRLYPIGLL